MIDMNGGVRKNLWRRQLKYYSCLIICTHYYTKLTSVFIIALIYMVGLEGRNPREKCSDNIIITNIKEKKYWWKDSQKHLN